VISTVTGSFKKFEGSLESENENDFNNATVELSIDANSIYTNQPDRDTHLKSPDFFSAEEHPAITFKGKLTQISESSYKLSGPLTIRGTAKPIDLDVEFGGIVKDPWGNIKAGFELNGKINRKDFGLTWNAMTEAGGVVVGEEVKIHINVELVKS